MAESEEALDVVLNLRISKDDKERIAAIAKRSRPKSYVARAALRIGLAQIEAHSSLLEEDDPAAAALKLRAGE